MAKTMKEWTVRVINYKEEGRYRNELPGLWVEQFRYMGMARELATLEDPERTVIEFYAPRGADSLVWAEQNAARMRSFGINAAAAPKWSEDLSSRPLSAAANDASHMTRLNRPE